MSQPENKKICGIITDGSTDYEILVKFTDAIIEKEIYSYVCLSQKLRDAIDAYKRKCSTCGKFSLLDANAKELRKNIVSLLFAAITELKSNMIRDVTCTDIIILNTDAEGHLSKSDEYFDAEWCIILRKNVSLAIEEFYNYSSKSKTYNELPLILPIIFFPSTDILVAAARCGTDPVCKNLYGLNAQTLKNNIYSTNNLFYLGETELEDKALKYITTENITLIYTFLPDCRPFINMIKSMNSN